MPVSARPNPRGGRDECKWCHAHPASPCPACAARRRRVVELIQDEGLSPEQVAERMRLGIAKVRRLIEEADQLRDLQSHVCNEIPVEPIRALFEQRQDEDPSMNLSRVAKLARMDRGDLRRALALTPAPGAREPSQPPTHINVETAGRIVAALGVAPHEIAGL
jgi:hypothetical protein